MRFKNIRDGVEKMDFFNGWINHSMGLNGRDNLDKSDSIWNNEYKIMKNSFIEKGTLLYRVHAGGYSEPIFEHYEDYGSRQSEKFNEDYKNWKDNQSVDKIRWDNHWVSFTKSIDVIGSAYFGDKLLRGFVIVIESDKAIDISWQKTNGFNECEVVAPMNKNTCLEILQFEDFIKKYGTGNSYYEKCRNVTKKDQ